MIRKSVLITMAFASLMGCKEEQKARADALAVETWHIFAPKASKYFLPPSRELVANSMKY
jgi:hypothetical protein